MPTVLVVDDSSVDRRLLGGLLEHRGDCAIAYAANGREALEQIEQRLPDLVLTDLQMPEMNGLELMAAIKDEYPLIPVVLITAKGSEEIAAQALKLGAASYVPKRRLAEDLLETVERVLIASRDDRTDSQLMHHLAESESVFELSNDLTLIRSVVRHFQQVLRCLPLGDETERLRVSIAVEEALKNAYYHGNLEIGSPAKNAERKRYDELAAQRLLEEPYVRRKIFVRARITRSEAVFHIRDEGSGFDHSKRPDLSVVGDQDETIARGLTLMATIMDEVTFNPAGNEVTLTKRRIAEPEE